MTSKAIVHSLIQRLHAATMELDRLHSKFEVSAKRADPHLNEGRSMISAELGVALPRSYVDFITLFGPGTLGGFLHILPVTGLQRHRSRLEPFMDDELVALLKATGDVAIFADSDNGDMCGWQLHDMRSMEDAPVLRVFGFDGTIIASSISEFIEKIVAGHDLFGIGALPLSYVPNSFSTGRRTDSD